MAELAKSLRPVKSHGQIAPGNIDLYNRPRVPNPVGGDSTVYSASFNIDGQEVLLPLADEGRILTKDEAVQKYLATGKHLGTFNDPASATQYAGQLHDDYARGRYDMQPAVSHPPEAEFQDWYARMAQDHELSADPGGQSYDYRSAMMADAAPDATGHWPSEFKQAGHPNEIVGGFNTRTGQPEPGYRQEADPRKLVEMGWSPEAAQQLTRKK